jgi:hypothetical protein
MKVSPDLGINFYCLFKKKQNIIFLNFFLFVVLGSFYEYVTDTHMNSARIGIDSRIYLSFEDCFSIWYYIIYVSL